MAGSRGETSEFRVSGVGVPYLGWMRDRDDVRRGGDPARRDHAAPAAWLPVAAVGVTLVLWASAFVAIRHLAGTF